MIGFDYAAKIKTVSFYGESPLEILTRLAVYVDEVLKRKGLDESFVIEVNKEDDGDWVACCGVEYSEWKETDND